MERDDEYRMDNMDDPTLDWDCSPPVDVKDSLYPYMWMKEFVKLHHEHEKMRTPWVEREKNLRALRARLLNDG